MNILITGGTGFVGSYLSDYLKSKNNDVFISTRKNNLENYIHLNLNDYEKSRKILLEYKFDKIFHLSSQSSVHVSFEKPYETLLNNINSTINLLKICQEQQDVKLIIAGTSEIYKPINKAISENCNFEPSSPYAMSKLVIDQFIRLMSERLKINVVLLRLFNHTGPGQDIRFALPSFSKQLAKIKLGLQEPIIKTGNLQVCRDFSNVKDVIKAYDLVSDLDECYGEVYNVCSGKAYLLENLLKKLIEIANVKVKIETNKDLIRRNDPVFFFGSYKKIQLKTGWMPEIKIEQTLQELFDYWMNRLAKENVN